MQRRTIRCFLENTNCQADFVYAVTPSITKILSLLDGRCTVFCPVIEQPEICDIEKAYQHFHELEAVAKVGGDVCG